MADGEMGKLNWEDINAFKLCGFTGISLAAETAIVYPMWIIKTLHQISGAKSPLSVRDSFRTLWKEGGPRRFYKGYVGYVGLAFPSYAVYVVLYNWSKSALGFESGFHDNDDQRHIASFVPLAAGFFADIASLAIYIPIDLCAQRLQVSKTPTTFVGEFRNVYRKKGVPGFFQGSAATLAVSGLASSIWWLSYENLKKSFQESVEQSKFKNSHVLEYGQHFAAGSISSIIAATCSNPLDVLKTRIQVLDMKVSLVDGMKQLIKEEGLFGTFRKGLAAKLLMVTPLGGISSFAYEMVLYYSRK
jgi:hypothetical protein